MVKNPYQVYKQQSVMTMTQCEMLTMLYDGLLKELNFAKKSIEKKDFAGANSKLQKSQLIIKHLQKTLNFQYDIANNLDSLYDYFIHALIQANMKKNCSDIDTVIGMVSELKETFVKADKSIRQGESVG